jgi:signal transduction histidine kinase
MEALGILAGTIIHDFNNLLMVIQSDATMILREIEPDNPHYERLESIQQEVKNGALLLEQMLGFARGGATLSTPSNINDVIEHACKLFGRSRPDINIATSLERKLWMTQANTTQIDQVFLNLFFNAADAMPEGGKLDVRTGNATLSKKETTPHQCKPGAYVWSCVKDNGIGMDEKTRQRIFEPFFTTKAKGRGTGLGLASVYGIIKDHGGFVTVQSKKGKGSTFYVYLPAVT